MENINVIINRRLNVGILGERIRTRLRRRLLDRLYARLGERIRTRLRRRLLDRLRERLRERLFDTLKH